MITAPDVVVIGLRGLSFIALFQATGCVIFLWLFRLELKNVESDLSRLIRVATYAAVVLTIAHHFFGPARLTGSFNEVFDLSLQVFLLQSSAGSAHALRIAGLMLIIFSVRPKSSLNTRVAMLGVFLTLGSFVIMGHTTTQMPRLFLSPLLFLHVSILAFWFGSLLPLIHVTEVEEKSVSGALLTRFSAIGIWSVPLILMAGTGIWYLMVPSLSDFTTPYSKIILGKITVFIVLMALAALNKWRHLPSVRRGDDGSLISLRRGVAREWSLMALAFIATAVLTGLYSPE